MPRVDGKQKTLFMHRLIMNNTSKLSTDHINGNGLDNRKVNLRIVSVRENSQNQHVKKTSIYPGLYFNNQNQKWISQISINGKHKHLGCFKTEIEAFKSYVNALKENGLPLINEYKNII